MVVFFEIRDALRPPRIVFLRSAHTLDRAASATGAPQGQQAPVAEPKHFLPRIGRV